MLLSPPSPFSPPRQRGFTLTEVLVSAAVLGVALAGLASLQAWSARMVGDAAAHTRAVQLATDLTERIRANAATAASYNATGSDAACNPLAASAANDLACWFTEVAAKLPGGEAAVSVTTARAVTITVKWTRAGAGGRETLTWNAQL